MWITPFLIGSFLSPWTFDKILAFVGIFCLYVSSTPLLMLVRGVGKSQPSPIPSLIIFFTLGMTFLSVPLWRMPEIVAYGLIVVPLFLLNIYFAKLKKERLFINDVIAIIALSSTAAVAVHLGYGAFEWAGVLLWTLAIIFFTASVFHVKSLIREKKNRRFQIVTKIVHIIIIVIPIMIGYWWISIAFIPSAIKAFAMTQDLPFRPMTIGIVEIANSLLFAILTVTLFLFSTV